jgi:lipoprotein-anchoring transpeptidase ErfK/SrfK
VQLHGIVQGEDDTQWYVTDSGYIPLDAVFVPDRGDQFAGRWLDVDLNTPTRVTAYEAGEPVGSFLAIRGTARWPTPVGVFTILRRVANETMNSESIGIPRASPGGYFLTNVLFTQYFTGDGASFHYNYWSANWGLPGSHGCLGLTYGDSAWLWEWARVGTPVSIHY